MPLRGPRVARAVTLALLVVGACLVVLATPVTAQAVTLNMYSPPQGETTVLVGGTDGTETDRWFYTTFEVRTSVNTLSVTVHFAGSSYAAPLYSWNPCGPLAIYRTEAVDITKLRSPATAYATASGATTSGTATIHFKKNGQLITCAPDYAGHPYVGGGNGPASFDCSGFQYYLYRFVGIMVADNTAQGYYTGSTKVTEANLKPGDWIFFDYDDLPPSGSNIGHTGVYAGTSGGNKVMWEASSSAMQVQQKVFTAYYEDHSDGLYGHYYGTNERF
jgi:cell wall-associated NlpC family hydrolase